tara:strand:+ start:34945 stop:35112 length:168 start_codon:yes stop_codon:yes gene_type:complete
MTIKRKTYVIDNKEMDIDTDDVIEQNGERYIDIGGGNYAMIINSDNVNQYKETLH